jgi:drug/metabolite transporter (DMT)-like permease
MTDLERAGTAESTCSDAGPAARRRHGAQPHGERQLLGIVLVITATVFLASGDIAAKYLSSSLPAVEIAWLRYLGFVSIVLLVICKGGATALRSLRPGLQVLRGLGLLGSAVLFLLALRYLPVADVTAIFFVSPVFVTALSIPFLGESVERHRWAAALIGLVGVLIIIRPGSEAFHPAALLPILGALSWAGALIATRKMSGVDAPITTLAYSALVGCIALSAAVPFVWVTPTWRELLLGALVGIASTTGHWIVVLAYRYAEASALVPYSYVQLIWASVLGWFAFGTSPDLWTYAGAAVILGSALVTAHRERLSRRGPPRSLGGD